MPWTHFSVILGTSLVQENKQFQGRENGIFRTANLRPKWLQNNNVFPGHTSREEERRKLEAISTRATVVRRNRQNYNLLAVYRKAPNVWIAAPRA